MNKASKRLIISALVTLCGSLGVFGGSCGERSLTLKDVQDAWNMRHDGQGKSDAVLEIMKQIDIIDQAKGTNREDTASIKTFLLDAVTQMPPATNDDYGIGKLGEVMFYKRCLHIILNWNGIKERGKIMKIANSIARFKPLPEINLAAVMPDARSVDECLKYGPVKPPRRGGITGNFSGPASERVYMIANFRKNYNQDIQEMKKSIASACRFALLDAPDKNIDDERRRTLWEEFVKASGAPDRKE